MSLTQDSLIKYMRDDLGVPADVGSDTQLFTEGVLDSVSMVNLIVYIEEQAKVTVQPSDVTLDNFDSVSRILNYVRGLG